jgi:hypothetical protein
MPVSYCPTCGNAVFYGVCSKCHPNERKITAAVAIADRLTTYALDQLILAWNNHLAPSFQAERSRLDNQSQQSDEERPELSELRREQLAELEATKHVLCNLFVVASYHIFEQNFVGSINPP